MKKNIFIFNIPLRILNIILTAVIILPLNLYSQLNIEWENRYNNPVNGEDGAFSIDINGNEYSFVTGRSYNGLNYDIVSICYDQWGNQVWKKIINGSSNLDDEPRALRVDKQNNSVISAITNMPNGKHILFKYNFSGDIRWLRDFSNYFGRSAGISYMHLDNNDNIYTWGFISEAPYGAYILAKFNPNGDTLWTGKIKDTLNEGVNPIKIICDTNGYVYTLGNNRFTYLAKFSPNGEKLWQTRRANFTPTDFCINNNGEIFITGSAYHANSDIITLKFNNSGAFIWESLYNQNHNEYGKKILTDDSGYCYTTGNDYYLGDILILKYNNLGDLVWQRNISGSYFDNFVLSIKDQNIFILGCKFINASFKKISLSKFSKSGIEIYSTQFNSSTSTEDIPMDMKISVDNNIFITGKSFGSTHYDFSTLKLSQTIGINPISTETPFQFSLFQNYPNPFNPLTKIKFDIPLARGVNDVGGRGVSTKLSVHDILGREIATLVNQQLKPGTYEADWDASNYPSGIYFYTLTAGEFKETKKMVLIK